MIRKILDAMTNGSGNGNGDLEAEALEAEDRVFDQARKVKSDEVEFNLRAERIRAKINTARFRKGGGNEGSTEGVVGEP